MKNRDESGDRYQIKITLRGSKPPIWRRFVVPANIKLPKLHEVIQTVMGWSGGHLHAFEIWGEPYTAHSRDGVDLDMEGLDENKYRLDDLIKDPKASFRYEYDFGDGWEHTLSVENILPQSDSPKAYECLAGKGRCPLEDCGGIWGYYHLLEVLKNPKDPEHEEMMEWAGGEVDPEKFDLEGVNRLLDHYFNKSKK